VASSNAGPGAFTVGLTLVAGCLLWKRYDEKLRQVQWSNLPVIKQVRKKMACSCRLVCTDLFFRWNFVGVLKHALHHRVLSILVLIRLRVLNLSCIYLDQVANLRVAIITQPHTNPPTLISTTLSFNMLSGVQRLILSAF